MNIKEYATYNNDLKYESIDAFSDWLEENLSKIKTEKRECVKIRLLLEEILLRARENFGEDVCVSTSLQRTMTGNYIKMEFPGEAFNPLSETNAELGDWNSSLQTAVGLNPKYSYSWGKNSLKLKVHTKTFNPVLMIFVALAIGVALGIIGHFIVEESIQNRITDYFLSPAFELWLRVLNAISGPIVFFTVATTMLNTKVIDKKGGNSTNVVLRYFGFSFLIVAVSVLVALPYFPMSNFLPRNGIIEKAMTYLDSMVPGNIVEPFLNSNTPQLLVVAFVLGATLIVLGNHVENTKTLTRQVNMIGLKLAEWVSKLVPIFAGLFVCMEIIEGKIDTLKGIYIPLLLSTVASVGMMVFAVCYVSLRVRVKPKTIFQKIRQPFFIALKTGSLDASFEQTKFSCIRLLGVDKSYAGISLPQGLVLYMPVSAIGIVIFTMYTARVYDVKTDLFWVISAIVFAVLLFVATPPVPGANLLAYVVFFKWLEIPNEALMDAMIFDIVFGILANAGNQLLLQIEMILQARKIGILDETITKKPYEEMKGK